MTTAVIPISRTVYTETQIHIIECAACSIDFGIGANFVERAAQFCGLRFAFIADGRITWEPVQ